MNLEENEEFRTVLPAKNKWAVYRLDEGGFIAQEIHYCVWTTITETLNNRRGARVQVQSVRVRYVDIDDLAIAGDASDCQNFVAVYDAPDEAAALLRAASRDPRG